MILATLLAVTPGCAGKSGGLGDGPQASDNSTPRLRRPQAPKIALEPSWSVLEAFLPTDGRVNTAPA